MAELESSEVMSKVLRFLSSTLQRVSETNDTLFGSSLNMQTTSIFHGLSRPTISLKSYLERIFKYANCSPSCFVVSYIYLDRFVQSQPSIPINTFNVHRLLITSVLISAKFMDDIYYNNAHYAKVGGISTTEMNLLEVDFLFGLRFQLNISTSTFDYYCNFLRGEMLLEYTPICANIRVYEEGSTHQHQHQLEVL